MHAKRWAGILICRARKAHRDCQEFSTQRRHTLRRKSFVMVDNLPAVCRTVEHIGNAHAATGGAGRLVFEIEIVAGDRSVAEQRRV